MALKIKLVNILRLPMISNTIIYYKYNVMLFKANMKPYQISIYLLLTTAIF